MPSTLCCQHTHRVQPLPEQLPARPPAHRRTNRRPGSRVLAGRLSDTSDSSDRSFVVLGHRNIIYGLEEEDGLRPDQVPSQADIEEAARWAGRSAFVALFYPMQCRHMC